MNNDSRIFKDALYDQFARIGKAVSNPRRLEILDLLGQGERRVEDLAREANLPIANASQHLQALLRGHLVERRRAGTSIHYRLADERVFRLWQAIRELGAAQLAEVESLTRMHFDDDRRDAIDLEGLRERLQVERVILLDVRPTHEYRAGHLPGAISMPADELPDRLHELPKTSSIVAYCRGPYCVFADDAVKLLREHGYQATRMIDGVPDWKAAGLPVESAISDRIRKTS